MQYKNQANNTYMYSTVYTGHKNAANRNKNTHKEN